MSSSCQACEVCLGSSALKALMTDTTLSCSLYAPTGLDAQVSTEARLSWH